MPIPDSSQPGVLTTIPWPAECQHFGYLDDGRLWTVGKNPGPCAKLTKTELQQIFSGPTPVKFEYGQSRDDPSKGLIIVTRSDVAQYREIWQPFLFLASAERNGIQYLPGDLLLSLIDLRSRQTIWFRHLRRVPE